MLELILKRQFFKPELIFKWSKLKIFLIDKNLFFIFFAFLQLFYIFYLIF